MRFYLYGLKITKEVQRDEDIQFSGCTIYADIDDAGNIAYGTEVTSKTTIRI